MKRLFTVYNVRNIKKIWKLAEKEYNSANLIGIETCSSKKLLNYTIWSGKINNFIKDKKYKKYKIKINNKLSNNIAHIYNKLEKKGYKIKNIIEYSKNKKYLNVFFIVKKNNKEL